MAIQNRRGAYVDFDPTKMVAGEFAVVQSGDENTDDGKALYVAPTTGSVKRIPFADELEGLVEVDDTLTEAGAAADAKKTGDEITALRDDLRQIFTSEAKAAILDCFNRVFWKDSDGKSYIDALEAALYGGYPRITALFNSGATEINTHNVLDDLKQYLTVTYYESRTSQGAVIPSVDYTLSGQLLEGENIIRVSYSGLSTTFVVNVVKYSARRPELPSEYEQVEYIKGNYKQYITTGLLSQIPLKTEATLMWENAETRVITGAAASLGNTRFLMFGYSSFDSSGIKKIGTRYGNNNWLLNDSAVAELNKKYDLVSEIEDISSGNVKVTLSVDGVSVSAQYSQPTVGNPIYINKVASEADPGGRVRYYSVCIYSAQQKIFDGIPCYRKSDGKTGLFDAVTNTFLASEGTEEFITGEIVE